MRRYSLIECSDSRGSWQEMRRDPQGSWVSFDDIGDSIVEILDNLSKDYLLGYMYHKGYLKKESER